MPVVLPGSLHTLNHGAIGWSYDGHLCAYGCNALVVVLHSFEARTLQTLSGHRANVCAVRFASSKLLLASADAYGCVLVWEISAGTPKTSLIGDVKSIADMHWLPEGVQILILYQPSTFILWNGETGTRVWRHSYNFVEPIVSFSFDPFEHNNVAFLSDRGSVTLIDDFSTGSSPTSNGRYHFRMSSSASSASASSPAASQPTTLQKGTGLAVRYIGKPLLTALGSATGTASGDEKESLLGLTEEYQSTADECLHAIYSKSTKQRLLLVYAREILCLDVATLQTVAHVVIDRGHAPLLQVFPCAQRDAFYSVQGNGCVTLRAFKFLNDETELQITSSQTFDVYAPVEASYEIVASSDTFRTTKHYRIYGAALSPVYENRLALLMSNGRVLFYDLSSQSVSAGVGVPRVLGDLLPLPLQCITDLQFVISAMYSGIGSSAVVVRSCPSPDEQGRCVVAVGSIDGYIQLVDIENGDIFKDFSVHQHAIKCLEWAGTQQVISAGYSQTLSSSSVVRNELFSTDTRTGLSRLLRPECDESPIEMIRVSHYNCYLAVAFRTQPLEIWDLQSLRLLRCMSRKCPMIVQLAWSGKHHQARPVELDATEPSLPIPVPTSDTQRMVYRENLVVLDDEARLYHIVVKGMHVKDGKEVSTQWKTSSAVTVMQWKDDYLVFGDGEGKLQAWNLRGKQSKVASSGRSAVRVLRFSHQPGDYTLVCLHSDGVSLWNAVELTPLHNLNAQQLISTRDLPYGVNVIDVDLVGSNLPALLGSDGMLRIYDRTITQQNSAISSSLLRSVFCPALLPPTISRAIRAILADKCILGGFTSVSEFLDSSQVKRTISEEERSVILSQLNALESDVLSAIVAETDTVQRQLAVARLLGVRTEIILWSVVARIPDSYLSDIINRSSFSVDELSRSRLFDLRRCQPGSEQLNAHVERLILQGCHGQALQILLHTDPSNLEPYSQSSLRACIVAAVPSSSQEAISTVKLVATNLIAQNKLMEGVQLLCLIGKQVDAVRYLQSANQWEKAAWLARCTLPEVECTAALNRWVDHLAIHGHRSRALEIAVAVGSVPQALHLLAAAHRFSSAVALQSLQSPSSPDRSSEERERSPSSLGSSADLAADVYAEYARELLSAGLMDAAMHYCVKSGSRGESLKKEIEILSE